ncbi:hypothetical protein A2533_01900 [Candidatus Falkowbacteria bacterium RIFOXYD2_FULL_35_9]|uniref:Large ribosomal subunit protein bL25 n=1 Tax=Candidatus Falkowbacteria bacterium RIFOXYC2_FULL_36_12 TaxID=1798002 RepID=A0A1F5SYR5_9BACT|nr:MAG: hypothetical protein A2300_01620 [Candidatus Falkowbacteria bacterium RIFOXYB2_FULL_35_7]OGF31799.1 MAG: hypothetical protein A2478_04930 [Candidatus Falkowbacteria bacterium RIFOXYC2_FULL_36_12]OGF33791.1 MAG: hypothetical protein A2223_00260 [Candidatus Falkowbacteria bacterium RIFOXYA2_FULL_35_8]OGF48257.1 MAG: hypothetical protein A2533_01900 [Candidatus Falkowbacteria bacterium RIFOXYD2_FULL_35_9]
MQVFNFSVKKRLEMGRNVKDLAEQGMVSGVVYGPELEQNFYIKMREADMKKLYSEAGESSLINLTIEGEKDPMEVLIKDVVYNPVKPLIHHVDFYKIKRGQKIEAVVELEFIGEAPAVKALGGMLSTPIDEVTIKCLPKDLLSEIKVDLSVLKTFDAVIHVKDLQVPEGVEIMADKDDTVATVNAIIEEVLVDEKPTEELPKVEGEEKAESGESSAEDKAEEPAGEAKKPE